jgi:3',5'-cyclic AMP phosphodiesterase CpdA
VRTIAHLSDLHFGREDPAVVEALVADLAAVRPSLVAVSGDLTQRARSMQFRAARAFLDRLPAPRLVVPGNHDVPLFDLVRRFADPLGRYRRLVSAEVDPVFEDEELVVVGVSTARSNVWKGGRISLSQIERVRLRLCDAGGRSKVLVAHHPFAPGAAPSALVGRGATALRALEACGLDLVLTGHLHRGHAGELRHPAHAVGRALLTLHASTAVSRRRRGEPNSYNLVRLTPGRIEVEVRAHRGGGFAPATRLAFVHGATGGGRAPDVAPSDAGAPPPGR